MLEQDAVVWLPYIQREFERKWGSCSLRARELLQEFEARHWRGQMAISDPDEELSSGELASSLIELSDPDDGHRNIFRL